MSLENVFVIGELSQVIIDNYPNYKIVQTGKEIDYGLIQKELKKNHYSPDCIKSGYRLYQNRTLLLPEKKECG